MDYLIPIFGLILVVAISVAILIVYIKRNIENAMVGAIAKIEAVADFLEESDEIEPPEAKAKRFVDLSEDQILLDLKVGGKTRLASMGIAGVKAQLESAAYMLGYNKGG